MKESLLSEQDLTATSRDTIVKFQDLLLISQGKGLYNRKMFLLIAAHTIFASFFLALPFFLFKKPKYCMDVSTGNCCEEGDQDCVSNICTLYGKNILDHVVQEESLTYLFQLFCKKDWIRVAYKIFPESLSLIGFVGYGILADHKGRKVSVKISWRMYIVGIIIFSSTQSHLLKMLGYVIACINCFPSLILQFIIYFEHNIKKQKNRSSLLLLACLSVGPLILSLAGSFIINVSNRLLLILLCALPALILGFMDSKIYESAICLYRFNKEKSFGVLNCIAKQNKQMPILIDLSKSYWHRYVYPKTGLLSLLKLRNICPKLLVGFFFVLLVSFNSRLSQISLDGFTETEHRSLLVNIPTALADFSLCLFLLKFKTRSCHPMNICTILIIVSILICKQQNISDQTMKTITIVTAVLLRYLSELCDGLLLIWSIETFPTICRGYCVCLVFCGYGLGILGAYLLRDMLEIAYVVAICLATVAIITESCLEINKFGVMKDTLEGGYYDENDTFCKS